MLDTLDRVQEPDRGRPREPADETSPGLCPPAGQAGKPNYAPLGRCSYSTRSQVTEHEILSAEQPCILCAQPVEVVTWFSDRDTGEDRIERVRLDHSTDACKAVLALYREEWPWAGAR